MANVVQRYKHQQFQTDACNAICNVFIGQPNVGSEIYKMDPGNSGAQTLLIESNDAYKNHRIEISESQLKDNIRKEQIKNGIKPIDEIAGYEPKKELNLSVEMETGTGKTYVYIKTIHELHKRYGWTKFIIVVPSIAIREGTYHSLVTTEKHFNMEYSDTLKFFIYNSARLQEVEDFATDENINVMIINSQAFATNNADSRIFTAEQAEKFNGRSPMSIISKTNPIIILDEPQSTSGTATVKKLHDFNPLFILRYSATHRDEYNMLYRLDSIDAYNQNLVKKIAVKGIAVRGNTATNGYVYVSKIDVRPGKDPTVWLEIDHQGANRLTRKIMRFEEKDDLYVKSGKLAEYQDRWVVSFINGFDKTVTFTNGIILAEGKSVGDMNEDQLRRVQIRETIRTHLEKEETLFNKNIKVLSLFFIGEVAKYRPDNNENGLYKQMFEEEYQFAMDRRLELLGLNPEYEEFLKQTHPDTCNEGYFSKDKKGKLKDTNGASDADRDSYDLIMKNKERLLSFDEPVRFIFSHSALKEGWDNTNVFQICALKNTDSNTTTRRQELGRGMRLCVNQNGERMDEAEVGENVHKINVLTVIASESYEQFAAALQDEYKKATEGRLQKISEDMFVGKIVTFNGQEHKITKEEAGDIVYHFTVQQYIDKNRQLTSKYYEAVKNDTFVAPEGFKTSEITSLADRTTIKITDAGRKRVPQKLNRKNFEKAEFQELWNLINQKSFYTVDFKTEELVDKAIKSLDAKLQVTPLIVEISNSGLKSISDNADLNMAKGKTSIERIEVAEITQPFDLIGEIARETALTRKAVVQILTGIRADVFDKFKANPQEFIKNAIDLINEAKAISVIEHIEYNPLEERFSTDIFTKHELNVLEDKSIETPNHNIYERVVYDSNIERDMAKELECQEDVSVYTKLPNDFYISTPMGKYNPDWAIVFKAGNVKHIYFVAETKGVPPEELELSLKDIEKAKIKCAKKHFAKISSDKVKYEVVNNYENLLKIVMS